MRDLWEDIGAKLKELGGAWTTLTLLGSFGLYLLGYLSLRFQLTFLGAGTDLAVLDERYFYAGAQFVVYLVTAIPIVLLLLLVLAACAYLPYRLLPAGARERLGGLLRRGAQRLAAWCSSPARLGLAGIALSVVTIQFVMRQPFLFANLLVAEALPEPRWLRGLLLTENEGLRSLYFAALVTATLVTGGLAVFVSRHEPRSGLARLLSGLLLFLAAVQFLLLPVNYAFLLTSKAWPKVASLGGKEGLPAGREAWLIWEGKEGVTFLLAEMHLGKPRRSLVMLPRKEIERIEITGYDPILRIFFAQAI